MASVPSGVSPSLIFYLTQRFLYMMILQMRAVAVGWQVYSLTGSAMDLGLVGLMQFLPVIGFSLVAGQAADRFHRKNIILIFSTLDVLASVGLCLLSLFDVMTTAKMYALLLLIGTARSFAGAASQSMLPCLAPGALFNRAIAWNSSLLQFGIFLGPVVGGLIYGFGGSATGVYAVAGGGMALAVLCVFLMRAPREAMDKGPITWSTVLGGIHYIWQKQIILGAISLDLFAVLLGGAVALLPAIAKDVLNVGPAGLGLLRSAPGVGAAITGLFLAFSPLRSRVGKKLFV